MRSPVLLSMASISRTVALKRSQEPQLHVQMKILGLGNSSKCIDCANGLIDRSNVYLSLRIWSAVAA